MNFFKQYYEKSKLPWDKVYKIISSKEFKTDMNIFCIVKENEIKSRVLLKIKKNYLIIYNKAKLYLIENLEFLKIRMVEKKKYVKLKLFNDEIFSIYFEKNINYGKLYTIWSSYCVFDLFSIKYKLLNKNKENYFVTVYTANSLVFDQKEYIIEEKFSLKFIKNINDLINEIKIKRLINHNNFLKLQEINQNCDYVYLIYNKENLKPWKNLKIINYAVNSILYILDQIINIFLYIMENNFIIIDFNINDFFII